MGVHAGRKTQARPDINWMDDAACHGIDNFLNEPFEGGWTDAQRIRKCRGHKIGDLEVEPACPVINECLEYALSLPTTDIAHRGLVFGGYTGQQLAKIIKKRRKCPAE